MLFSEGLGITPPKNVIQLDFMDAELRNGLWNSFYDAYMNKVSVQGPVGILVDYSNPPKEYANSVATARLFRSLWEDFFKGAFDEIRSEYCSNVLKQVRLAFFEFEWYEVYNFLVFVVCNYSHPYDLGRNNVFIASANKVLERELSGYRFVGNTLTPITAQDEISSIEKALEDTTHIQSINAHLKTALGLFLTGQFQILEIL